MKSVTFKTARARTTMCALGMILGVLLFSFALFAQGNFGRILGTVTDQSGAVIAGATVSIIDLDAQKVIQTLNVNVRGANRLKFTPDGKLVFVSTLGAPDLVVLDATTRREVKRVPIGHGAAGILMQPDGQRAYVSCTPDDYIVVIDLKSLTVTGKITAGKHPDGLAWAVRR